MFNVSVLLLDDTLLKCVVTEFVLFSVVAFETLTFHKVRNIIANFLLILAVKSVEIVNI